MPSPVLEHVFVVAGGAWIGWLLYNELNSLRLKWRAASQRRALSKKSSKDSDS